MTSQGPLDTRDLGPPCSTKGTLIATINGAVPVQDLKVGDSVLTADHGYQSIRWVGRRTVSARGEHAPIRITKGALGNERVLIVSPQHKIVVTGWRAKLLFGETEILVAAKSLVNGDSIHVQRQSKVEYCQIIFDQYEINFQRVSRQKVSMAAAIWRNGIPCCLGNYQQFFLKSSHPTDQPDQPALLAQVLKILNIRRCKTFLMRLCVV